jgi:Holliday junction resolvase
MTPRLRRAGDGSPAARQSRGLTVDKSEIIKLQTFLRRTLGAPSLEIRPQPKRPEMAEVFIRGEFQATLYKVTEDGETEYQFQMCILEDDLEDV